MCRCLASCTTTRQERHKHSIHEQLDTLARLVRAGRCAMGLSNETPYGVHEFVPGGAAWPAAWCRCSKPVRPAQPQLGQRLDETCHRLGVSLLAYSPLGYSLLTGKYDRHAP